MRTLLLSNVRCVRDALVESLTCDGRVCVAGACDVSDAAVDLARDAHPDVALLDMAAPRVIAVAERLHGAVPDVRTVAFGVADDQGDVVALARVGCVGFVAQNASVGDLVSALIGALRGDLLCSPAIAARLCRGVAGPAVVAPTLTRRECEVLALIDEGLTNKEIARRLQIGASTVKNHVHKILQRLRVRRRSQAAARIKTVRA